MAKLTDSILNRLKRVLASPQKSTSSEAPPRSTPDETQADASKLFQRAREHHARLQFEEAEALYRGLLQKYPKDFDLLHLLGMLLGQKGDFQAALDLVKKALAVEPRNTAALVTLGNCYRAMGQLEEALAIYDQSLAINPKNVTALENRSPTLHALKRPEQALASYDALLAITPDNADALTARGELLRDLNRPVEALVNFESAARLKHDAITHFNCANAYAALDKHEQAILSYNNALELEPGNADILSNRGESLRLVCRYEDAVASIEQALQNIPNHEGALINHGLALRDMGRHEKSLASFDKAIAQNSKLAIAHYGRGTVLTALERFDDALTSHKRALSLHPKSATFLAGLALALRGLNRHTEALSTADQALAIESNHATALVCRALSLSDLQQHEQALLAIDRALALEPDNADAHNNRGVILNKLRRPQDALASFEKALAIDPRRVSSLINRADALSYLKQPDSAFRDYSKIAELDPDYPYIEGYLLRSSMACCDWRGFDTLLGKLTARVSRGERSTQPFHCIGAVTSARLHRQIAEIYVTDKAPGSNTTSTQRIQRNSKIRLGYVAGEFRQHATSVLTVELFERHNRDAFEVVAFDNGWDDGSPMRKRLVKAFDNIVDVSRLNDEDAACAVLDHGIDVLVDLNGHVGRNRTGIFRLRAAPVQVNWLGYPGTMGAAYMDYIIADPILIPEKFADAYTEKIVRLPDSYQINDSQRVMSSRIPTRAEAGLPDSAFVFCCFNDNYKITPEIFGVWMKLLRHVDGSVLWLYDGGTAALRNLRAHAAACAVNPARLIAAPPLPLAEHLARHCLADLFLDTLPCNAHTTASDALWAGLPLVTCTGETFASRVAASLLHATGLPELVTENIADYEALALKLASTPALLSEYRRRLADNRTNCPLFDSGRFTRHIESAYVTMHERSARGLAPKGFDVTAIQ